MDVTINKIFNGFVSVRDNVVEKCISLKQDLVITHDGEKMVVPYDVIANPFKFQIHKTKFKSKYNTGQTYELYDFKWDINKNKCNQSKLF